VTLREVPGEAEELRALQRVMESDEDYFSESIMMDKVVPAPR
jgi:hypothetical protein